jgi:hypothetical protein
MFYLNIHKRIYTLIIIFSSILIVSSCGNKNLNKGTSQKLPSVNQDSIEYPFIGYVKPKSSKEINNSPWGLHISALEPVVLDKAAQSGVKWTRLKASWTSIENQKGKYDWSELDTAINKVLNHGITPFVTIDDANELYTEVVVSDLGKLYGKEAMPPTTNKEAMDAWLTFVKKVLNRYKDRVKYWEIWNEPNHSGFWYPKADPEAYSRLLIETSRLINEIDPQAKIIGGVTAGIDVEFVETFLKAGADDMIDVITFHDYREIPEKRLYNIENLWKVINKYNPDIELWQGETGFPSHSRTTGARLFSPWGLNVQAKWLLRQALVDVYYCETEVSNYFKLGSVGDLDAEQERPEFTGVDTILGFPQRGGWSVYNTGVNQKGILFNDSQKPKNAYYAYQNLCALLDNSYQKFHVNYDLKINKQGQFYGIKYDDVFPSIPLVAGFKKKQSGSNLIFYWLPWRMAENINDYAQIDLELPKVQFDDPVLLDLISGKIYDLKNSERSEKDFMAEGLPLGDYPFAIAEKDAIEITQNRFTE